MCPVAAAIVLAFTSVMEEAKLEAQLARFPPRKVTDAWVEFNDNHFMTMYRIQSECPDEGTFDWVGDIVGQGTPWTLLQQAQNRRKPIASRMNSFDKFKIEIGRAAFIQGKMPLAVPLSRFREGKPPARLLSCVQLLQGVEKPG
jgi:hypothetical protein